jgi:CheY-like chemotaxis protein
MSTSTILITDDEPHMRRLIAFSLKSIGADIVQAASGEETVQLLSQSPVDLMLVDYELKGMNGLDTIQAARKITGAAEIPVILLTARGDTGIKDAAQTVGVSKFLTKTFSPVELKSLVQQLLEP